MPQGRVSHYRILEYLGGTMGKVYVAEDELLRRKVALKFLPSLFSDAEEDESSRRFMTEARSASVLDHRNICTIHEIGRTDDGEWFIAMGYYEGKTLKHLLGEGGLEPDRALDIARQTALGLAAAHEKGVVHRDIKPANIMITDRGRVKILDFGLARLVGASRQTRTGTILGTAAYMSPEQARGETAGPQSDIWSLGVVLYEMLAGRLPFAGETDVARIYSIIHKDPASLPAGDCRDAKTCARILEKCLDKKPERRYASARVLAEDLELAGAEGSGSRRSHTTRKTISIKPHRLRRAAAGAVVALFLAVAAFGFPAQRDAFIRWLGFGNGSASVALLPFGIESPTGPEFGVGLGEVVADRLDGVAEEGDEFWMIPGAHMRAVKVADRRLARDRMAADFIVSGEGTFDRGTIDLEVRLFDSSTGAEKVRRFFDPFANLQTWQADVVAWLAREIDPRLVGRQLLEPGGGITNVPDAFVHYCRSRGLLALADAGAGNRDSLLTLAGVSFAEAVAADSSFVQAWVGLGNRLLLDRAGYDDGGLDRAAGYLGRARRLAPRSPAVSLALSRLALARRDSAGAVDNAKAALAARPGYLPAIYGLIDAHHSFGNDSEAARLHREATRVRSHYPHAFRQAGLFHYYQSEFDRAVSYWKKVLELAPNDYFSFNLMGIANYKMERWPEARRYFEESLEVEPSATAYSNLATLDYYESRFLDSVEHYRKSAAKDLEAGKRPDLDYHVYQSMAEAFLWASGHEDSARVYFDRALEFLTPELANDPDDPDLLVDQASFYAHLGRSREARAIAVDLATRDDLQYWTMLDLAVVFEVLGDRDRACRWLEASLAGGQSLKIVEAYPVLRNLRSTDRYQEMKRKYEKK